MFSAVNRRQSKHSCRFRLYNSSLKACQVPEIILAWIPTQLFYYSVSYGLLALKHRILQSHGQEIQIVRCHYVLFRSDEAHRLVTTNLRSRGRSAFHASPLSALQQTFRSPVLSFTHSFFLSTLPCSAARLPIAHTIIGEIRLILPSADDVANTTSCRAFTANCPFQWPS